MLPAAARRARRARRSRVGLTPVLCDQLEALRGEPGERYLRFLRDVRAPIHAEDSTGSSAAASRELAAEVRRAGGRLRARRARASSAAAATCSARSRALGGVELWTSSATHAVLPLLATDAGLRLQLAHGHRRRTGAASAAGAAGFWLPECAYAPGLERASPSTACARSASTRPTSHGLGRARAARAGAHRRRPGGRADRLADGRARVERARRLPGARATYRDYHRRTIHDLRPWANDGAPYDRERGARARARARARLRRAASRGSTRAGERGGLAVCCALDTELLGHWWYEGPELARRGARRGRRRRGSSSSTARRRRSSASSRCEPRARPPRPGARRKDLSTWDWPAVAELAFARARRRAAHRGGGGQRAARARRSSARRASCSRSRPATGRSWSPATWPPTTRCERAARARARRSTRRSAL